MTEPTAPVVPCPSCVGLTFTVTPCLCRIGGNRLLVDADDFADEPYQHCERCHGAGSIAQQCADCGGRGEQRAQLVLTVASLDSGALASANVVPGSVTPTADPVGGWQLALAPIVAELAAAVDVPTPAAAAGLAVPLPPQYRPTLPDDQRDELVAAAIARRAYRPWLVFTSHADAEPPPNPARALARWCALADLLRLDLVVEARTEPRLPSTWRIRLDVPGSPVPPDAYGGAPDLPTAISTTSVADTLRQLGERGRAAPAYTIRDPTPGGPPPDVGSPGRLARRIRADLARAPGAQAIWRNGRWWHTPLHPGPPVEQLVPHDTGQVSVRRRTPLIRAVEPPAPSWQGEPIPHTGCPDCLPGSRLRRCECTYGGWPVAPDCPNCHGAGVAPSAFACLTCGGSQRIHQAVTVTVTDLRAQARHELWTPRPHEPATPIGARPGGPPVLRLAGRYRLADRAASFGVRPEELTDAESGLPIGRELRDGIVVPDGTPGEPAARFVRKAAAGRPGARLIVAAVPPDAPPLPVVVRLAVGLRLDVTIGHLHRRYDPDHPQVEPGHWWDLALLPPGAATTHLSPPGRPTLAAAIAHCLEFLDNAVTAAVPPQPDVPLPVPQAVVPVADPIGDADPVPALEQLARHWPDQPILVRLGAAGCDIQLAERDGLTPLARARTLTAALTALGLHLPHDS